MRADADPGTPGLANGMGHLLQVQTPKGEYLIMDPTAKLEKGCTVAVFLAGDFLLVGRIDRRPVPHRRLVIRCCDVHGTEGVTRIHGLRDEGSQIWRVVGVLTPVPFADVDRGGD